MDNYPLGAADDPRAPWNENEIRKDVTVRAVLVKDTTIVCDEGHLCVEYEIDPDTRRRIPAAYWKSDYTDEELFRQQYRSPVEIIEVCEWICRQLVKEGRDFMHCELEPGRTRIVDLRDLSIESAGWDEEEFVVTEKTTIETLKDGLTYVTEMVKKFTKEIKKYVKRREL